MGIDVLGPLVVEGIDHIGPRDRVVLEVLVVRAGEFVAPDVIADALWGETVPASWSKVVQGCVARLRKSLGAGTIQTSAYGYRLVTHDDLLDARRFERLLGRAREHLADRDADRAAYVATDALALWRGRALPDVDDWEPGHVEAERLDGLRMDAEELRVEAEIAAGRARQVLEDGRALVAEAPYRESRWALFARALYQSGRQSEALEVLQRARRMLLHELGLEPGAALVSLEEAILRQDSDLAPTVAVEASAVCPYRGLLPYEAEDAESFFGRDDDVAAALRRLREREVLAVVGASGAGKSSLVRAGVVSALREEGTEVVVTTPGPRPMDSLSALPRHGTPVLVVDQAEEAITLCHDHDEREKYFHALGEHGGPLVLVLRADYLVELCTSPTLARLVETGLYMLSALDEENLRAAIEGPARHAGLRLEPGLVDLLVREVAGQPGALPLLSHVLRQTWEHREGGTLTVDGYRSTGGVRDAVAQTAESLYEGLNDPQREQLRALFLRLVMPSGDGEPVRARVSRSKLALDPAHERLVESLVAARLVSSDEGDLQIAHEALAREWPRLRGWLEEDVEGQRIFRHLTVAAEEWEALGRPDSELYRGVRLVAALDWSTTTAAQLTATEGAFLDASRDESERERLATEIRLNLQRRANRRLRGALAGIAVLLVASLVAGVVAVSERNDAQDNETRTLAALTSSDAHRISLTATTDTAPGADLLLAVEANRLEDSPTTRNALLKVLAREPHLERVSPFDNDSFSDVGVSPDGSRLAVASWNGNPGLRLIDAASGRVLRTYKLAVARVKFLDATRIAVGLSSQKGHGALQNPLRILNARTLEEVPEQLRGQGPPTVVRFGLEESVDHRYLAAGFEAIDPTGLYGQITVRAWDQAHPGRPIFTRANDRFPAVFALTPGRKLLFGADGHRKIEAFDLSSGLPGRSLEIPGHGGLDLRSSALSPDGRTLAVTLDNDVVLIDTRSLRVTRRWTDPNGAPGKPEFSQDGTRLLTVASSAQGGFTVWSVPSGRELVTAGRVGVAETYAAFGGGRDTAYTANQQGLMTWRLDRATSGVRGIPTQPLGRTVGDRMESPDGKSILYLDSAGARPHHFLLQLQSVTSGRVTSSFQYPKIQGFNDAAWNPDSTAVAVTEGNRLRTFQPGTGRSVIGSDLGAGHLSDLEYLSRDSILAVSEDGIIVLANASTLRTQRILAVTGNGLNGVAISADRRSVLVSDDDGHYSAVNLRTGKLTQVQVGTPSEVSLSPHGGTLAVVTSTGDVGLYDLRQRTWIDREPSNQVYVEFTPNGRHFVTGDGDSRVSAWNARTGKLEAALDVPDSQGGNLIPGAVPHRDEVLLIGPTGQLWRWEVDSKSWIQNACHIAGRNLYRDEWKQQVGNRPYHRTCPQYPVGG